jgi:hypothetical protein
MNIVPPNAVRTLRFLVPATLIAGSGRCAGGGAGDPPAAHPDRDRHQRRPWRPDGPARRRRLGGARRTSRSVLPVQHQRRRGDPHGPFAAGPARGRQRQPHRLLALDPPTHAAIMLFDAATGALPVEIDGPQQSPAGRALGGDTVAYLDYACMRTASWSSTIWPRRRRSASPTTRRSTPASPRYRPMATWWPGSTVRPP